MYSGAAKGRLHADALALERHDMIESAVVVSLGPESVCGVDCLSDCDSAAAGLRILQEAQRRNLSVPPPFGGRLAATYCKVGWDNI